MKSEAEFLEEALRQPRRGAPYLARWLRADLAASRAPCTLAFWHGPRFTSGRFGQERVRAALLNALYRAKAEVVVNGHEHFYERFAPQTPEGRVDSGSRNCH